MPSVSKIMKCEALNSEELGVNNTTAEIAIHNGDGLCFFTPDGELSGCKVNKVENGVIIPNAPVSIRVGDAVYRNADEQFLRLLQKPSATRKIAISIHLTDTVLTLSDGNNSASVTIEGNFETSNTPQTDNYKRVLSKLGDTIFEAENIAVQTPYFIPASVLTNARRTAALQLLQQRLDSQPAPLVLPQANHYPFPLQEDSYRNNIANQKARHFYAEHGAETTAPAFELQEPDGAVLMFCKHCIRYALGACPKNPSTSSGTGLRQAQSPISEPLFLIHKNYYLKLSFNCKECVMEVSKG
jgi:putative protease